MAEASVGGIWNNFFPVSFSAQARFMEQNMQPVNACTVKLLSNANNRRYPGWDISREILTQERAFRISQYTLRQLCTLLRKFFWVLYGRFLLLLRTVKDSDRFPSVTRSKRGFLQGCRLRVGSFYFFVNFGRMWRERFFSKSYLWTNITWLVYVFFLIMSWGSVVASTLN